jgi:molybdopterin-guanine dinucleotide biosynthesis adapter protein
VHVFGFAGYSGSGKTTLMENVIPLLIAAGLRISVIKHTHHSFDIDTPGKDSWRHRQAGAGEVLVASGARWALLHETRDEPEAELPALVGRLAPCDLVLVEGFKRQPIPKLEVYRSGAGKPAVYPDDPSILAVVTDTPLTTPLPTFGLAEYPAIAGFIMTYFGLEGRQPWIAQTS